MRNLLSLLSLSNLPKILSSLTFVVLFGLIIHFFLFTFLEFVVGIDRPWITFLSLWKEVVVWLLILWTVWYNAKRYWFRSWIASLFQDRYFKYMCIAFAALIVLALVSSLINGSLGKPYIVALRYNFFPFILLLLSYQLSQIISLSSLKALTKRYTGWIKWIVWLSLVWYLIISTLPGALRIFWYDRHVFEGKLGERPPAAYYAALDHGAPRNQFLRERPIFFWFYLIAFWPLFFLLYLRKAPKHEAVFYGLVYLLSVFTTFSRSAWWVRIVETGVLFLLVYGKTAFKYLRYILIPLVWLGALVGSYFYYEIFGPWRNFSNTGHINALLKSLNILQDHWLWWLWAWSAWPASHQLWVGFNPENQYLQIMIEYGIFGFLCWLWIVWYLSINGLIVWWWNHVKNLLQDMDIAHRDNHRLILLSCNIWLIGLGICWLVLHSRADKMVIWPLMMVYGLRLGAHKERR